MNTAIQTQSSFPLTLKLARRLRSLLILLILGFSALTAHPARALEASDRAVQTARRFLDSEKTGTLVLDSVHYLAKYQGHQCKSISGVTDSEGRTVPGHFALTYRYRWDDDGWTNIVFFCDAQGRVYEVQAKENNAIIQTPFTVANAAIQIVGNVLLGALKDNMTDEQRRTSEKLVDQADAKGMLELSLKLRQAFQ
ncbi:MAG TPA: hypothetical protein VGO11_16325 [Chthoniobacteraceae bacterium]|jgi:hypothetical protein|nr:hypothetical protein [Chthoniobacteraceae bacterium]